MSAAMPANKNTPSRVRLARTALLSGFAAFALTHAPSVQAQVSREVVQPTPTRELNRLNDALLSSAAPGLATRMSPMDATTWYRMVPT